MSQPENGVQSPSNIFLWAVPRSLSTAFYRAMESRNDTKLFLEPYSYPYYFGEERISNRYEDSPMRSGVTFHRVTLDLELEGKQNDSVLFVKDMAYYILQSNLPLDQLVPKNYVHTFLIRDPRKSVKSLYKMSMNKELTGWHSFQANESGFQELWELYDFLVKQNNGNDRPLPLIIDADDLLHNPEGYLRLYCQYCNIEFKESMLNWKNAESSSIGDNVEWKPWFEGVLASSSFIKPMQMNGNQRTEPQTHHAYSISDLPEEVLHSIDQSMVYYTKLHQLRTLLTE